MPIASLVRPLPAYTVIAALLALLHNLVLIAADAMGAHYVVCQIASALILLPTGFLAMARFTFSVDPSLRGFLRYSGALLTNFPVAIASLWLLCDVMALEMIVAAPASTVILAAWNYLTSSWAFAGSANRLGERP